MKRASQIFGFLAVALFSLSPVLSFAQVPSGADFSNFDHAVLLDPSINGYSDCNDTSLTDLVISYHPTGDISFNYVKFGFWGLSNNADFSYQLEIWHLPSNYADIRYSDTSGLLATYAPLRVSTTTSSSIIGGDHLWTEGVVPYSGYLVFGGGSTINFKAGEYYLFLFHQLLCPVVSGVNGFQIGAATLGSNVSNAELTHYAPVSGDITHLAHSSSGEYAQFALGVGPSGAALGDLGFIIGGSGATTSVDYVKQDCNILTSSGFVGCLDNAMADIFYPNSSVIQEFAALWGNIYKKPPIGYFTVTRDTILGIATTTGTTTVAASVSSGITAVLMPLFKPVRAGLVAVIWIVLLAYLLFRIARMEWQS